jgi:tetratricopeptide (TPR) repeat protein
LRVIHDAIASAEFRGAAHLRRAIAYIQKLEQLDSKDDGARALADLTETIRLAPTHAALQKHVRQLRAGLYFHTGDYDRALGDYTELIRLDPTEATTHEHRGYIYAIKGHHERAIADYTEAVRLQPKGASVYHQRGWSYLQTGKPAEALSDANQALALGPSDAGVYALRGLTHRALGNLPQALTDLRNALSLDPADKTITEELRKTEQAQLAAAEAKRKEASRSAAELRRVVEEAQTNLGELLSQPSAKPKGTAQDSGKVVPAPQPEAKSLGAGRAGSK